MLTVWFVGSTCFNRPEAVNHTCIWLLRGGGLQREQLRPVLQMLRAMWWTPSKIPGHRDSGEIVELAALNMGRHTLLQREFIVIEFIEFYEFIEFIVKSQNSLWFHRERTAGSLCFGFSWTLSSKPFLPADVNLCLFTMLFLLFSGSLQPYGLQRAKLPCLSPSPRVCSDSYPLSQWCYPTISSSVLPSPPALNLPQHQGLFLFTIVNYNSVYRSSESCESFQKITEHKDGLQEPQHISQPHPISPVT